VSSGRARRSEESGFTLIELVVVLMITAVAFTALAAMLAGTMKGLSISKTRAQANELATQGIEDLQRFDFDDLGLCPGVSDPAPSLPASLTGLATVQLPNCTVGTVIYEQPCSPPVGTLTTFAVPRQSYLCVKNNVSYTVNRYIRWTDASHTGKRLAVYVLWNDQVGGHQISQESSLRSPNAASIIGNPPPQFVNVSATAPSPVLIDTDGTLLSTITFAATTNGLTSVDTVYVTLDTLTTQSDGTVAALPTQFTLTSGNGINWTATIPGSQVPKFGAGSQYVTFTEVRASDAKANSRIVSTPLTFCPNGGCPSNLPTISSASVSPALIDIDSAGVLQSTFTVSVSTTNLTTDSSVTALAQTQTGAASLIIQPSNSCVVGGSCNSWTSTFAKGSTNLRFLPGNQVFYITAITPVNGSGGTNGSSTVGTTNTVTLG
jgi:prepilin-type N-terminal cleavage/methylation domain-containing protein